MRMWMLDPKIMCNKHINAEHGEIHKHFHNFIKKQSIKGRIIPIAQIEPLSMKKRHDELAKFLNHNSPYEMPDLSYLPKDQREAKVDRELSKKELIKRCPACRELILKEGEK